MMWKLVLILIPATCLFGNTSPSEAENGQPKVFFEDEVANISSGIWPSNRSVDVLHEMTPVPSSDSQTQSKREVSGMLDLKPDEMASNIALQGQQESSTLNEQGNYPQLNETEKRATTDDTGFTENTPSMSGTSTSIEERNENSDSKITPKIWSSDASKYLPTRSFFPGTTEGTVTSPLSFHATSDESITTSVENTSLQNNFSVEKDERPIVSSRDTTSDNSDAEIEATTVPSSSVVNIVSTPKLDQTFSEKNNPIFLALTTTQKKFSTSKSFPDINGFSTEDADFASTKQRISKGDSSSGIDEEPVTRLTTLISQKSYVYPSAATPLKISGTAEDTVYDTSSKNPINEQNFTEKSNSFSALSTGEQVSSISELSSFEVTEINSTQTAVNESSFIYSGGNTENNSFEYSPGVPQITEVSGESPLIETVTTPTPFYYDEDPPFTEVYNMDVTTPYSLKKFESTSSVLSSNDTKLTTFELPGDSELPPSKQLTNDTFKLIFIRKCHGDNMLPQTFKTLYSIMNIGLNAKNSTQLTECKQVYEFKFTSNIASPKPFKDVLSEIKEKLSPVHAKIVNYDSEIYEISPTSEEDIENFVIPKILVYVSTGATGLLIVLMIFVVLCIRNKCKRGSSSINLSELPHLTLSIDDYKLSPIPRPSVSIRDNNRDFLYAYSNETYSRTKEDDIVLSEHHFSKNAGQEFIAALKTQRDKPQALEMQTFEATRGTNRPKSEIESHFAQEFATPNSLDGLKGRKRHSEHPAMMASRW